MLMIFGSIICLVIWHILGGLSKADQNPMPCLRPTGYESFLNLHLNGLPPARHRVTSFPILLSPCCHPMANFYLKPLTYQVSMSYNLSRLIWPCIGGTLPRWIEFVQIFLQSISTLHIK